LLRADAQDVSVIRQSLAGHKDALLAEYWRVLEKPRQEERGKALQAASALALYDPRNPLWEKIRIDVANRLVAENSFSAARWVDALYLVADQLRDPLTAIFRDEKRSEAERSLAASALAEYVSDQPVELAELLMDASEKQFTALFPLVEKRSDQTAPLLEMELTKKPPSRKGKLLMEVDNKDWDQFYRRQANAAVALIRMGRTDKSWFLLKHNPDPSLRSYLLHSLGPLGVEPDLVASRLNHENDVCIRRGLILSLGEYAEGRLSTTERDVLTMRLLDLYRKDPDPGIHGATDWLLRQWRNENQIKEIDKDLGKLPLPTLGGNQGAASSQENNRGWYVNSQGQTMVIVRGPVEFEMGEGASQHRERIGQSFAVANKEVTVDQFERFLTDNPELRTEYNKSVSPSSQCPQVTVSWYQAAAYCDWLSKQEGLPKEQRCYLPNGESRFATGMRLAPRHLRLTGYRLPTESEWECACRAGTKTNYCFGNPEEILVKYGWAQRVAKGRTWLVGSLKPNDFGIFDMHGNAWEWCQDIDLEYSTFAVGKPGKSIDYGTAVEDRDKRSLRGGAFLPDPGYMHSDSRFRHEPNFAYTLDGFRPARTICW
jgi:formylglycine-generating enzyme required for sulfatase activity